jgi:hypothetical protein
MCCVSGDPDKGRGERVPPGHCRPWNDLERDTQAGRKARALGL